MIDNETTIPRIPTEQLEERVLALQIAVEIHESAFDFVSGGKCECVPTSDGDSFCR